MPESLCPDCRAIDFRKYINTSRYFPITLGTWSQICSSTSCSFCRLVRDAISLHAHKPASNSTLKLFNRKSWRCCTSYNEYHGIRWQAYSNEFDLQSYAEKTRTESRYQFVIAWVSQDDEKKRFEVFLRPVQRGPFFGKLVDQRHADLKLCRKWLDLCDDYHQGSSGQCVSKQKSSGNLLESLRLIDVDKMIIVKWTTSETQYVALSYVWGEDRMKRDMPKSVKTAVQVIDGIETIDLPKELPRTIRDAIHVTSAIGYRYLWVDSLCIVQDDEKDRHNQINMMDEIYSNATLTIAAGSGLHADWGLPGVSRTRHFSQRTEIVNDIELAVEFPSFRKLNSGTTLAWNSRGWTLQEKVLSKRLLLFTDFQMYFRCSNSVCAEDIAMETRALSTSIKKRSNPFEWGFNADTPGIWQRLGDLVTFETMKLTDKGWNLTFLPNYVALVAEYSQRNFRFKRDTLQAISGVLQTLDLSDLGHLAFPGGLPQAWLAEGLLWQPREGSKYSLNHKDRAGTPTWSWGAWNLSQGCVWTEYAHPGAIARGAPQTTIHVAEQGGYIRSYYGVGKHRMSSATESMTLSVNVRKQLTISGTLLSFETSVCKFEIGSATQGGKLEEDKLRTYYLLDTERNRVGKIWTCKRVWKREGARDFIALSDRHTGIALKGAVADKYLPKDSEGGKQLVTKWKVRNVMLVGWRDGVALRVAIGQVISTAWNEFDKRLIYLG